MEGVTQRTKERRNTDTLTGTRRPVFTGCAKIARGLRVINGVMLRRGKMVARGWLWWPVHPDSESHMMKTESLFLRETGLADEVGADVPRQTRVESVNLQGPSLPGDLSVPPQAKGLVMFAHGSGSSRHSARNRWVADALQQRGLATLLFDLLTVHEAEDRRRVFDIPLLGRRVVEALRWVEQRPDLSGLRLGLFGASTGAAAALLAAADMPQHVAAVVSRGGRPDLIMDRLPQVQAPTLLIVGGLDPEVLELNRLAFRRLSVSKRLEVVPGATHLFAEPGALDSVAALAGSWFEQCFAQPQRA